MSEIIKYRDFDIVDSTNGANWFYTHTDWDGDEDNPGLQGVCDSLEECKQEIDDWYMDKGDEDEKS